MSYVTANAIATVMLVCALIVAGIAGGGFGVLLLFFWLILTGGLNYMAYSNSQNPLSQLQKASKQNGFIRPIRTLTTNYHAIMDWAEHAKEYDAESSITKSYELLSSQMNNIIESASKYVKTYDWHTRPKPKYLLDLVDQSNKLVARLHELQELILKVDDSTSDVDITYVDDLLQALREVQE